MLCILKLEWPGGIYPGISKKLKQYLNHWHSLVTKDKKVL